ncbi:MAG: condensation domain-containing protein, partial [Leadbetterella sp.]|nr:condensation domain-containing protein [Leadbetterella sp.]
MKTNNIEDLYPLSPMQHGMLFHSLYSPNSGMYFEQFICKIQDVNFEIDIFRSTWQQVLDRHGILRTAFVWENVEEPLQFVRRYVEVPLNIFDWREKTETSQLSDLINYLQIDRAQGFNLSKAPLMRLSLIRITDTNYYFIWSLHHILLDAWSISILLKEIIALY